MIAVTDILKFSSIALCIVLVVLYLEYVNTYSECVYADNNATTPMFPIVIREMNEIMKTCYANPSSIHALGARSRHILDDARKRMGASIGAYPCEVTFVSGSTEANNLAIRGLFAKHSQSAQTSKFRVITTSIEHPSIYQTLNSLPPDLVDVVFLPVDKYGVLDLDRLSASINEAPTHMVCVIAANNEIGTIQHNGIISNICKANRVHLHLDMTQIMGKYRLNFHEVGCDTATFSAHKFHGPKGVGVLYIRDGVDFTTCITGGGQEMARRAGTENLAGIHGTVVALEQCMHELAQGSDDRVRRCRDDVQARLEHALGSRIRVNGHATNRLYNTLSVCIDGVNSRDVIKLLDDRNIYVNSGCACSKGKPSITLSAIGIDNTAQSGSFRISFGFMNHASDATRVADAILQSVRLRYPV